MNVGLPFAAFGFVEVKEYLLYLIYPKAYPSIPTNLHVLEELFQPTSDRNGGGLR